MVKLNSERKQGTDSFFNPKEFIRISCIVAKCWKIAFHLQVDQTFKSYYAKRADLSLYVSCHKPQNYNSPKLCFCCSINRLQHYIYRRKKNNIVALFASSDFSPLFYIEQLLLNSPFTKSNGGTVTAHHVSFAREKSLTSFTPGKLCI